MDTSGEFCENFAPPTVNDTWLRSSDTLRAAETNIWNTFWLTGTFRDSKKKYSEDNKEEKRAMYYLEQGVDTMFGGDKNKLQEGIDL